MSFFEKSVELLQKAEARRGQWTPQPGSWYFKYYEDYRRRKPNKEIGRCGFFHAVGLQWLYKAGKVILYLLCVVGVVWLVTLAVEYSASALLIAAGIGVIVYLAAGIFYARHVAYEFVKDTPVSYQIAWLEDREAGMHGVLLLVFLPVLVTSAAVILGGIALLFILGDIIESRAARWLFKKELFSLSWFRPILILPAGMLIAAQWIPDFWMFDVALVVIVVVAQVVGYLAVAIGSKHEVAEEQRKLALAERQRAIEEAQEADMERRMAKATDFIVRRLFAYHHPRWVVDGVADPILFNNWLERYSAYCLRVEGTPYGRWSLSSHLDAVNNAKYKKMFGEYSWDTVSWAYQNLDEPLNEAIEPLHDTVKAHKASRVGGFFSAILGFIVYVWTLFRYLYKSICPVMVDPEPARRAVAE